MKMTPVIRRSEDWLRACDHQLHVVIVGGGYVIGDVCLCVCNTALDEFSVQQMQ